MCLGVVSHVLGTAAPAPYSTDWRRVSSLCSCFLCCCKLLHGKQEEKHSGIQNIPPMACHGPVPGPSGLHLPRTWLLVGTLALTWPSCASVISREALFPRRRPGLAAEGLAEGLARVRPPAVLSHPGAGKEMKMLTVLPSRDVYPSICSSPVWERMANNVIYRRSIKGFVSLETLNQAM